MFHGSRSDVFTQIHTFPSQLPPLKGLQKITLFSGITGFNLNQEFKLIRIAKIVSQNCKVGLRAYRSWEMIGFKSHNTNSAVGIFVPYVRLESKTHSNRFEAAVLSWIRGKENASRTQ